MTLRFVVACFVVALRTFFFFFCFLISISFEMADNPSEDKNSMPARRPKKSRTVAPSNKNGKLDR